MSTARLFRNRRLAAFLICALAVYGFVGTLVPRGNASEEAVRTWVSDHPVAASIAGPLGLHHAFTSPFFLILVGLLAASTTACSIERTQRAVRMWRSIHSDRGTAAAMAKLGERPQAVIRVKASTEPDETTSAVIETLQRLGFRARLRDGLVTATSGAPALMGSPLFHWSIVGFILAAAIGQATASSGQMALPLNEKVVENHDNYLELSDAPFFGERHTDVTLELIELRRDYISEGVEYGVVPKIRASRDGVVLKTSYVHPNRPLHVGPLMIHAADYGPAAILAIESSSGPEIARRTFFLDRSDDSSSGTKPQHFTVRGSQGADPVQVRVQVVTRGESDAAGKAVVETTTPGASEYGAPRVVVEGEFIDLPGGSRLRLASVSDWSRVSVVNDRSLPFVYGFLVLMTFWLAVAIMVPTRCVWAMVSPSGVELHVSTWHSRREVGFAKRIIEALEESV